MLHGGFRIVSLYLFLSFFLPVIVAAQEKPDNKILVILWNGSSIKGYSDWQNNEYFITVYQSDFDSLIIPVKTIKSIHYSFGVKKPGKKIEKHPSIQFFNNTHFGFITGSYSENSTPVASISADMINGVRIFHFLKLGFGIGYDQYSNTSVMPLFLSCDGDIFSSGFTPFYFLQTGAGPAWEYSDYYTRDADGKQMFHLGIGYRIYASDRMNVSFSLGYKQQHITYTNLDWSGSNTVTERTYKRVSFRIGIGF